jgi:alpha-1,3-mannosyl-glycoprotein beta-1,2-N-acetylglucosaminyltransferase
VIIIEDDLDLSPDIFEYFSATLPILKADPTLWCVSAYNDNGRPELVDERAVDLLYRTDFFPGLGWMLTKSLWTELSFKWPTAFWDDWMREPEQRKGRSCIRPELSRTKTFGKVGVSVGLFYEKYLETIFLNENYFNFTDEDMSYLMKEVYDRDFLSTVRSSSPTSVLQLWEDKLAATTNNSSVKILYEYNNQQELVRLLEAFGLMSDIRSGTPRTAYLDIVSFVYGKRRVYLSPTTHLSFA